MGTVEQLPSGLLLAVRSKKAPAQLLLRPTVRTVTLSNGERAKVTKEPTSLNDESSVTHIERAEGIDAIVRPRSIRYRLKLRSS
jgi:hypothetical protein